MYTKRFRGVSEGRLLAFDATSVSTARQARPHHLKTRSVVAPPLPRRRFETGGHATSPPTSLLAGMLSVPLVPHPQFPDAPTRPANGMGGPNNPTRDVTGLQHSTRYRSTSSLAT